jgi:hypothetical protein
VFISDTAPIPCCEAFSMAMFMHQAPTSVPSAWSPSTRAVVLVSLRIFGLGFGFSSLFAYWRTYLRSPFETPWDSTPRRSFVISTSALAFAPVAPTPEWRRTASVTRLAFSCLT